MNNIDYPFWKEIDYGKVNIAYFLLTKSHPSFKIM